MTAYGSTYQGAQSIRECLQELNHEVRAREHQHSDEKVGGLHVHDDQEVTMFPTSCVPPALAIMMYRIAALCKLVLALPTSAFQLQSTQALHRLHPGDSVSV